MPETITMRRQGTKLVPVSMVDEEALGEIPEGKDLTVSVARQRSTRQHRFFWALLNKVCENHDTYRRGEQLLLWLKIRMGYVENVQFHDGGVCWIPQSISFNSMDQIEFKKFFDAALDVIVNEVIPDLDRDELIREVEQMLGFRLTDLWSEKHGV